MSRRNTRDGFLATLIVLCLLGCLCVIVSSAAHAAGPVRAAEVPATWRIAIERQGQRYFGLRAQPARMAAQIQQESAWRPNAASPYAQGLTQFTPATARWVPSICPEIGPPDVWDPFWAIGAQHCYMAWLHRRVPKLAQTAAPGDCDRWAFALRAYNGGEGWLLRERRQAQAAGRNANAWREVEGFRSRAAWAHRENIEYPQRILLRIEPAYLAAGWQGGPPCR